MQAWLVRVRADAGRCPAIAYRDAGTKPATATTPKCKRPRMTATGHLLRQDAFIASAGFEPSIAMALARSGRLRRASPLAPTGSAPNLRQALAGTPITVEPVRIARTGFLVKRLGLGLGRKIAAVAVMGQGRATGSPAT